LNCALRILTGKSRYGALSGAYFGAGGYGGTGLVVGSRSLAASSSLAASMVWITADASFSFMKTGCP
jgi:hypothetical protein